MTNMQLKMNELLETQRHQGIQDELAKDYQAARKFEAYTSGTGTLLRGIGQIGSAAAKFIPLRK